MCEEDTQRAKGRSRHLHLLRAFPCPLKSSRVVVSHTQLLGRHPNECILCTMSFTLVKTKLYSAVSNTSSALGQLPQQTTPLPYPSTAPHAARAAPAATPNKKRERRKKKRHLYAQSSNVQSLRKHLLEDCHRSFPEHLYTKISTYHMTQF